VATDNRFGPLVGLGMPAVTRRAARLEEILA